MRTKKDLRRRRIPLPSYLGIICCQRHPARTRAHEQYSRRHFDARKIFQAKSVSSTVVHAAHGKQLGLAHFRV